jgi:hypothetical protein
LFAFYFANGLLTEMGWPRKLGRFKGQGYAAVMVDNAWGQSMDWGAGLGAGRPRLALQMIAEITRDSDWYGDDPPNIEWLVGRSMSEEPWLSAASPQEAVELAPFANRMSTVSVEEWVDRQNMVAMEPLLFNALMWGLSNPDRFEAWYESAKAEYESGAPEAISHGLEIDETLPSLPEFFESSERIVRDYERDVQPLPPIPPRLLDDATALGWKIDCIGAKDDAARRVDEIEQTFAERGWRLHLAEGDDGRWRASYFPLSGGWASPEIDAPTQLEAAEAALADYDRRP